jgi:hypothetical protein
MMGCSGRSEEKSFSWLSSSNSTRRIRIAAFVIFTYTKKEIKKKVLKKKLALFLKVRTADPQNRPPLSYLPAKKIKRKK